MNYEIGISVRSALLVPKPNCVSEFVNHNVFVLAAISNWEPVLAAVHHSYLTPATKENKNRETDKRLQF